MRKHLSLGDYELVFEFYHTREKDDDFYFLDRIVS